MDPFAKSSLPGLAPRLEAKGITPYRLAKNLGWKPGTINRYLKGERSPAPWRRKLIAQQIDCEESDLFLPLKTNP